MEPSPIRVSDLRLAALYEPRGNNASLRLVSHLPDLRNPAAPSVTADSGVFLSLL